MLYHIQAQDSGSTADSLGFLGCLTPQFLTQAITQDSISKQFFHNFDGEGYYLFYVSDSCLDRQSGQEGKDAHPDIFPWFGSNRYNHLHHRENTASSKQFSQGERPKKQQNCQHQKPQFPVKGFPRLYRK